MSDATEQTSPTKYTTAQLAAAGTIALETRHQISNALAALLAESQLLALEPLATEQQAAVDRIIDLCRRLATLLRDVDAAVRAAAEA
jgi:signal transduction histidine kinase